MKKIITVLSVCVTLLLIASACTKTQYVTFGDISGTVIDIDTDKPISGVAVTLSPGTGLNTYTGSDGLFYFSEIEAKKGSYTVWVDKSGYRPDHKDVYVIAGETVNIVIPMKKL